MTCSKVGKRKHYLYDPKTNQTQALTYRELEGMTGFSTSTLSGYKSRGTKIRNIECYLLDDAPNIEKRRELYASIEHQDESWVDMEGSNNQFQVSNYGRVRRLYKNGNKRYMLPYRRKGEGNMHVKARFLGEYKEHKVGHIVAHHFIGARQPDMRLFRKNGVITDDYAGNLEYVSLEELGKRTGHTSRNKPIVQLDYETNELLGEYESIREAGRELFISHESIRLNVNGKTRKCIDYRFMCADEYELNHELKIEPMSS